MKKYKLILLLSFLSVSCLDSKNSDSHLKTYKTIKVYSEKETQEGREFNKSIEQLILKEMKWEKIEGYLSSQDYLELSQEKKSEFLLKSEYDIVSPIFQRYLVNTGDEKKDFLWSTIEDKDQLEIEFASSLGLKVNEEGGVFKVKGQSWQRVNPLSEMILSEMEFPLLMSTLPLVLVSQNQEVINSVFYRFKQRNGSVFYLDTSGNYFDSIDNWRKENNLPPGTVYYPTHGKIQSNQNGEVQVSSENTMRSSERLAQQSDRVAMVGSLVLGAGGIVSFWTGPFAPLTYGAIALSTYYFGRSFHKANKAWQKRRQLVLHDKTFQQEALSLGLNILGMGSLGLTTLSVWGQGSRFALLSSKGFVQAVSIVNASDSVADAMGVAKTGYDLATNWNKLSKADRATMGTQILFWTTRSAINYQMLSNRGVQKKYSPKQVDEKIVEIQENSKTHLDQASESTVVAKGEDTFNVDKADSKQNIDVESKPKVAEENHSVVNDPVSQNQGNQSVEINTIVKILDDLEVDGRKYIADDDVQKRAWEQLKTRDSNVKIEEDHVMRFVSNRYENRPDYMKHLSREEFASLHLLSREDIYKINSHLYGKVATHDNIRSEHVSMYHKSKKDSEIFVKNNKDVVLTALSAMNKIKLSQNPNFTGENLFLFRKASITYLRDATPDDLKALGLDKKGNVFRWDGFASTSTSIGVARGFNGVMFIIKTKPNKTRGIDLRPFSYKPGEEEILFPPGTQFRVDKVDISTDSYTRPNGEVQEMYDITVTVEEVY